MFISRRLLTTSSLLRRGFAHRRATAPLPSGTVQATIQPDARPKPAPKVVGGRTSPRTTAARLSKLPCPDSRRVVIELKKPRKKPRSKSSGKQLHKDPFATLFEYLDRSGVPWELHRKMQSDVFIAVSVTLASGHNMEELQNLKVVESVHPVEFVYLCDRSQPTGPRVLGAAPNML